MRFIVNLIGFNLGWFGSVLGAAWGMPWLGLLVVSGVVAVHLLMAHEALPELRLIVFALALGVVWDSLLVAAGWITYPSGMVLAFAAPYWIVAMWANFATLLNVSLRWLRGRPWLAAVLGASGGPLTYWGGAKLGGAELLEPVAALVALGVGWAIFTPLLVALARRNDGFRAEARPGLAVGANG
jgi:hypothetical protein